MNDAKGSRWENPWTVTLGGMVANLLLSAGKILAGVLFSSKTILADGVHSLTDLVSDIAVLGGLYMGDQPADARHPYGHRRVFTLVAMFIGVGLLVAAGWIGYGAFESLHHPAEPIRGPWPLVMALLTIPLKEVLFRWTRRAGQTSGNPALLANAWHHRTDVLTSLAAAAGIAGAMLGGSRWMMLDGITAIILSAFLLVESVKMVHEAAQELIDRAPGEGDLASIGEIVQATDGVDSFHGIRGRTLGGKLELDLHIQVDPHMSVEHGHEIASAVRRRISAAHPDVQEVIVHVEPSHTHKPEPSIKQT
jgi:cation diffusion facilitator family transporter